MLELLETCASDSEPLDALKLISREILKIPDLICCMYCPESYLVFALDRTECFPLNSIALGSTYFTMSYRSL